MSVTMYRFAVFLVGFVGAIVPIKAVTDRRECYETAVFSGMCCQLNITESEEKVAIKKECMESTVPDPRSCDLEICFGQKYGYLLSNGSIDMGMVEENIDKDFENYTDIKETVKEKCMVDDLDAYGPPRICEVKKLVHCLLLHSLLNCPKWVDSDHCNTVKDKIEECESIYP